MKTFMMILLFFMSTSAFASHPHDRVCVVNVPATAKTEAVQFIFQWEIERTYENGSSSLDPHLVTAEASFCLMDWQDDNCTKSKSAAMVLKPGENQVALKLIDTKDRKSTRLNSSHTDISRMPSSA